jgi:hypothetical protein
MRRRAFHEAHGGDERVEHARILAHARHEAEPVVERVRISPGQIVRMRDPDRPEIGRQRRSDVRDLL